MDCMLVVLSCLHPPTLILPKAESLQQYHDPGLWAHEYLEDRFDEVQSCGDLQHSIVMQDFCQLLTLYMQALMTLQRQNAWEEYSPGERH